MTYLFSSVFPAVAGYRLTLALDLAFGIQPTQIGVETHTPAIKQLLYNIVNVERRILKSVNMPFGSSILAVAQKQGR